MKIDLLYQDYLPAEQLAGRPLLGARAAAALLQPGGQGGGAPGGRGLPPGLHTLRVRQEQHLHTARSGPGVVNHDIAGWKYMKMKVTDVNGLGGAQGCGTTPIKTSSD